MENKTLERPSIPRTALMAVFSTMSAAGFMAFDSSPPLGVWIVCAILVIAPFINRIPSFAPKLLARAAWLQAAFLGLLIAFRSTSDAGEAMVMAIGSIGALIIAGRGTLAKHATTALPTVFRRAFILSLVFALADFQALMLYGTIFFEETSSMTRAVTKSVPFFLAGIAMGVSIFGLYRVKMWGLVACIISNVVVAGLAISGVFDLPDILTFGLTATALIQLMLPVPLVRQIVRTQRLS